MLHLPEQEWGCGLQFPVGAAAVAAFGFVVAALWIDTIATELVSIIEYLGLLSGVNHTVGTRCHHCTLAASPMALRHRTKCASFCALRLYCEM